HRDLRSIVCTVSKCMSMNDTNRHAVVWTNANLPYGKDEKVVTNRKAGIRLLPLYRPIAVFDDGSRDGRTLPLGALKDRSDQGFRLFKIRAKIEIEDQPCQAGLRGVAFPDASDTVAGKFADNGIDEIVRNIEGELVPGHRV